MIQLTSKAYLELEVLSLWRRQFRRAILSICYLKRFSGWSDGGSWSPSLFDDQSSMNFSYFRASWEPFSIAASTWWPEFWFPDLLGCFQTFYEYFLLSSDLVQWVCPWNYFSLHSSSTKLVYDSTTKSDYSVLSWNAAWTCGCWKLSALSAHIFRHLKLLIKFLLFVHFCF